MNKSRGVLRTTHLFQSRACIRSTRLQTTNASSAARAQQANNHTESIVGGLVGGGLVALGGYAWYHFSGARTFVNTAHAAKSRFEDVFKKSTEAAPEPNEALKWLRSTATSYAAFIPGARNYVDSAFNDLDAIHNKHGAEVDAIVKDAYNELKDATKHGVSIETVTQAWEILQKAFGRIGDLAGDAADDILSNHPELKQKFGGNIKELKAMGNQYGPEAMKKVDETWGQVKDIMKGGLGIGTADRLRKLIQEKTDEVRKMGDVAWSKGMEQAKPYLDKSPQLKDMLEQNKDKLMRGNLAQLWEKVKGAAQSGDTSDIEKFVKDTAEKASSQGAGSGGLEQYLNLVPGGHEIVPKLGQLQDIAQRHGDEAKKLAEDAFKEIRDVLSKKVEEGQKLADKAKADAQK